MYLKNIKHGCLSNIFILYLSILVIFKEKLNIFQSAASSSASCLFLRATISKPTTWLLLPQSSTYFLLFFLPLVSHHTCNLPSPNLSSHACSVAVLLKSSTLAPRDHRSTSTFLIYSKMFSFALADLNSSPLDASSVPCSYY